MGQALKRLAMVVSLVAALGALAPAQAGLVGYWNFDETGGDVAGDAGGNDAWGAIQGSARVAGKFGGALDFDGNDQVLINHVASKFATIPGEVTISLWQYGASSQPGGNSVFGGNNSTGRNLHSHLPHANGNIYMDVGNDGTYDRIYKAAGAPANYRGSWNHWAFTKDAAAGQMKIYCNGTQWHSGSGTRSMAGTQSFTIGSNLSTSYYRGQIDEFAVWNEALSPAAIAALTSATQAMTITAPTIANSLTNSGGALSPGGDGAIGTTTIAPGPQNVAPDGTATQSTTASGGVALRGNDGNTDGNWGGNSVTHTRGDLSDSWWQVALGGDFAVDEVVLYNRSDSNGTRLSNFRVSLLADGTEVFGENFFEGSGSVPQGGSLAIPLPGGSVGDEVQVQLLGKNNEDSGVLSLAEVQVFGIVGSDYTQGLGGTLSIELDAATGAADKLIVSGALACGGALDVSLLNGTLEPGDTFDILDWGSIGGAFDSIVMPEHDMVWDLSMLYETGEIHLTPEPTTLTLLVIGAIGLATRRRRRG